MSVQTIISAIDAYIEQLRSARKLLAGLPEDSALHHRPTPRVKQRPGRVPADRNASPSVPQEISVKVLPPKVSRNRRTPARSAAGQTALGGPVPQGPVVVRRTEVSSLAAKTKETGGAARNAAQLAPDGSLQELVQEVARRLNKAGQLRLA